MFTYFPSIQPFATHHIEVQPPHEIYVEECGNPHGLPVLFVHGGPGSGCGPNSRCFFDPNDYHIILFDQRGAGRSTPHAELAHNTTLALIEDIETIRKKLNIERWVIFGSSWGATLALVYAQTFPERIIAMILSSIFLGRNKDREWLYGGNGANRIFPDYWEEFLAPLPEQHRHHPIYQYYELLTGEDEVARMNAAETWAKWEACCSTISPNPSYVKDRIQPHKALGFARIESHYLLNNCFLEPNQILRNMEQIQHIPSILVHGREDMVCPLESTWELHKNWPESNLYIVHNAGHSTTEPGILDALIRATHRVIELFGAQS